MILKEFVLLNVKPDDYYAKRFPRWNPRVRGNIRCPFHSDNSPSLAISLRGGGAHCHASTCGKSIGNIVHFESQLKEETEIIVVRKLYREFIRKTVSPKLIAEYKDNLCQNQNYLLKIKKEMGLTLLSVKSNNLGLCLKSNRITIPIYDGFNQCVNIRFYKLPSERTSNDKAKIYNLDGYGGLDLFPYPKMETLEPTTPLFFMASEKEALLAIQEGLRAFTTTTGEGSWNPDWNHLIQDRDIFLVFDRDAGGEAASIKMEKEFALVANVRSIKLPFVSSRSDYKDFADWILKEKHKVDELRLLSKSSRTNRTESKSSPHHSSKRLDEVYDEPNFRSNGSRNVSAGIPPSGQAHSNYPKLPEFFSQELFDLSKVSSRSELLNKRIRTQGIVAAKAPNTFSIPWKFKITAHSRPAFEFELPMGRHLLMFIRSTDTSILHLMQKMVGCGDKASIEPIAWLTATEVEIIPTAVVDQDVPYVIQRCYYFGSRIEANIPYYLEIIPTSEIRTQETIGIITSFIALSKSIDKFELTPETEADLSYFWAEGGQVWDKLKSLANEISTNYTRIYSRLDWHLVALLSWSSPIGFRFPNDPKLHRGWINSLALGDTETGKSEVTKKFRELFQCGSFVSSENCTYAGLIGGVFKMGSGQFMLRWGRVPLSDKQLVILEELSGLSIDEISNMSDVRSSGVARLDKGGISSEVNARTRLLCLSNVRSQTKNLSSYIYGVKAIQELIGHGEDIARFDLITTLTDREVSNQIINANFASNAKQSDGDRVQPDQLQKLIHFIWSLTPEQILITNEAYEACLETTKKLATEYHPSIPIFKGGSGRFKLARIATSIACLQFAWNGTAIEVRATHIAAAAHLLRTIYNKQSFGYREYSLQMFSRESIGDPKVLRKAFKENLSAARLPKVISTMIHMTKFDRNELCGIAGIGLFAADQLISAMANEHAIRKGDDQGWEIEPAGKRFLEQLKLNGKSLSTKP